MTNYDYIYSIYWMNIETLEIENDADDYTTSNWFNLMYRSSSMKVEETHILCKTNFISEEKKLVFFVVTLLVVMLDCLLFTMPFMNYTILYVSIMWSYVAAIPCEIMFTFFLKIHSSGVVRNTVIKIKCLVNYVSLQFNFFSVLLTVQC